MRTLLMLCVMGCVADPAMREDPRESNYIPADPFVDGAFTEALAARTRPELELPPRPVTQIGRCIVEIGPRSTDIQALLRDEVAARNGAAATVSFDVSGNGTLRTLGNPDPDPSDVPKSRTVEETLALVVPFVVTNYDLFGLSREDVARARVYVHPEGTVFNPGGREIALRGHEPDLSTDPPAWRATLTLGADGHLDGMSLRSEELVPDATLCEPLIPRKSSAVVSHVLGVPLTYWGIDGKPQDLGVIGASDIGYIWLVKLYENTERPGTVRVRLAYRVSVTHRSLSWAFYVDPDTGEVIKEEQLFRT